MSSSSSLEGITYCKGLKEEKTAQLMARKSRAEASSKTSKSGDGTNVRRKKEKSSEIG